MWRSSWLGVMAVALAASSARAEVRLESGPRSIEVSIEATPTGVWSPVGFIDASVLNPEGDALGDGAPAVVRDSPPAVVWRRPSSESVAVATSAGLSWITRHEFEAPGVVGTPVAARSEDEIVVAWHDASGHAWFTRPSSRDSISLGEGIPVAVVDVGAQVKVLALLPRPVSGPITLRVITLQKAPGGLHPSAETSYALPRDAHLEVARFDCHGEAAPLAWWSSGRTAWWLSLDDDAAVPSMRQVPPTARGAVHVVQAGACRER